MRSNHIFVFFECFTLGGVERSALQYLREWVAAGRRVTLFVGANEGPLRAELPEGVELIVGNAHSYVAVLRPVIAAVRWLRPDVIFVPGNRYTSIAMTMRAVLGRRCPPMVVKVSNSFVRPDYGPVKAWGYRTFVGWKRYCFSHFVALSDAMCEEAIAVGGMARAAVSVIPDPVIVSAAAAVHAGPPTIAAVARMVPQKRVDWLVRAFALVPGDARLDIVGDGPEQPLVEAAIAECDLAGRVTLHGYLADPSPVIARARALALSSAYEGVPAVIAEAFAVGTPVVTTASSSSIAALIDDPRLGTVVPVDDIAALGAVMAARLAVEPDRAWIVAHTARAGWPEAAARYLELFDTAVAARPVAEPARVPAVALPAE